MGNELRQAYKAVCTTLTLQGEKSSKKYIKIMDLNNDSYARVFWTFNNATTGISKIYGKSLQQIGYSEDTSIEVGYSSGEVYISITKSTDDDETILIKTEIVYGTVKSFPSIKESIAENLTPFYLTDYKNTIRIETQEITDEDGIKNKAQKIISPGGINMKSAEGLFSKIKVESEDGANFYGTNWGASEETKEPSADNFYTLRQYIHKTIEADYIYNGSYEQNQ